MGIEFYLLVPRQSQGGKTLPWERMFSILVKQEHIPYRCGPHNREREDEVGRRFWSPHLTKMDSRSEQPVSLSVVLHTCLMA